MEENEIDKLIKDPEYEPIIKKIREQRRISFDKYIYQSSTDTELKIIKKKYEEEDEINNNDNKKETKKEKKKKKRKDSLEDKPKRKNKKKKSE